MIALAIPAVFMLLFNVRLTLYILLASLFLHFPLLEHSSIKPADIILPILIMAFVLSRLVQGRLQFTKTCLDLPILFFTLVLALSLSQAVDLGLCLRSFFRHLQVFLMFYVLVNFVDARETKKLLITYICIAVANSLFGIWQFIHTGGQARTFAAAGWAFSDLVLPATLSAYIFLLFERGFPRTVGLSLGLFVLLGGIFSTGTRGAILSLFLCLAIISAYLFTRRKEVIFDLAIRRHLKLVLVLLLLGSIVAGVGGAPQFFKYHGYLSVQLGEIGTIGIRLILWKLAWSAFWENPILGIGVGQFLKIESVFPAAAKHPLFMHISGVDPHHLILSYLAAAGILGISALVFLFIKTWKLAWQNYCRRRGSQEIPHALALLTVTSYVIVSSFYSGAWFWSVHGMCFMFFLALQVVHARERLP